MTELIREAIAPFIGLAVYYILTKVERRGYKQGYEDGINDHNPKHQPLVGFKTNNPDK